VASNGDAFIAHQAGSEAWSIGSGAFELVVGFSAAGVLTMQRMSNIATGRAWNITQADVTLTLGGNRFALASTGPFTFDGASAESTETGCSSRSRLNRALRGRGSSASMPPIRDANH
jgi:hypothetical protein